MAASARRCADCGSSAMYARDRCQRCYLKLRALLKQTGQFAPILLHGHAEEKLNARTEPGPGGCVLYTGTINPRGYGELSVNGASRLAHRVAYELKVGPIPAGLALDHTCHNLDLSCQGGPRCVHRRCINVEHLEPATLAENTRRGRGGVRNAIKTHCPAGHAYDAENTYLYDGRRYCKACNRLREWVGTRGPAH
ncbi:HNH endonuclease signature motif containing protein [Kitasatospora sp. NPDC048545]|uniref:HNH endonuclease signature motif containing protein n=1 Tax=Kitasatospora sp. NPDC048545 TaxID=3157208 RepID=UPI0033C431FA